MTDSEYKPTLRWRRIRAGLYAATDESGVEHTIEYHGDADGPQYAKWGGQWYSETDDTFAYSLRQAKVEVQRVIDRAVSE